MKNPKKSLKNQKESKSKSKTKRFRTIARGQESVLPATWLLQKSSQKKVKKWLFRLNSLIILPPTHTQLESHDFGVYEKVM